MKNKNFAATVVCLPDLLNAVDMLFLASIRAMDKSSSIKVEPTLAKLMVLTLQLS